MRDQLKVSVRGNEPPTRAILFDMMANDGLDITSAEMLSRLVEDLKNDGITILWSDVHKPVMEMVLKFARPEDFRESKIFPNVDAGVQYYFENLSR